MDRSEQAIAAWTPIAADATSRRWRTTVVREGPWSGAGRASLWGLGQVLTAALDLVHLGLVGSDDLERLLRGLAAFRRGAGYAPFPGATERYYDDNAWVGLALAQAATESGASEHEDGARGILAFLRQGTGEDGGVLWVDRGPTSRHTCSTAPTAQLALRVAQTTDDESARAALVALGEAAMGFLARELRGPDGLYADNVQQDGSVDPTVWSYNQGTPVGAAVRWSLVLGDEAPLVAARETADAALAFFADDDRLWRQPPAFNAIFFRNLLVLDAVAGYPPAAAALGPYLDRAWAEARDPGTGWFTGGGIGRYERGGVLDQAGLVQLYALSAWPVTDRSAVC